MASAAVAMLQTQINRVASHGDFAAVNVDGDYGDATGQGLVNALTWLSKDGCSDWWACADDATRAKAADWLSRVAPDGQPTTQDVIGNLPFVIMFLTGTGDDLGFAEGPMPDWVYTSTERSSSAPPSGQVSKSWCLMFPGDAGCSAYLQAAAAQQRSSGAAFPTPGRVPPHAAVPAKIPAPSSILARFQRLESWQKVGLGAGAVLAVLYLNKRRVAARRVGGKRRAA